MQLLNCVSSDNLALEIDNDLKNKEQIKKEYNNFIVKINNIRKNIYIDLFLFLSIENKLEQEEVSTIIKNYDTVINYKINEIFNYLDIFYHQLDNTIKIVKENNTGLGSYLKKGIVMGGAFISSTFFPTASFIAATVLDGISSQKSGESRENVKDAVYNLIAIKNRILLEIDEIFDIILEDIKNNFEENFQKILNLYINNGRINSDISELDSKFGIFMSRLKLKISGFNSIKEDISSFDESLNKFILDGQFKQIYDYLQSEEDKINL